MTSILDSNQADSLVRCRFAMRRLWPRTPTFRFRWLCGPLQCEYFHRLCFPLSRVTLLLLANTSRHRELFTSGARQKPATRTPEVDHDDRFEMAGRGRGKFTAPIAHEVYHRALPKPSIQESTEVTAQEQLPWIEGSEQEARDMAPLPDSQGLNERQQGLLKATTTDCAHGPIPLCLDAAFGNWEGFKCHCDPMKAHALKKPFCDYSRDFFPSAAPQESTTGVPRRRAGQG